MLERQGVAVDGVGFGRTQALQKTPLRLHFYLVAGHLGRADWADLNFVAGQGVIGKVAIAAGRAADTPSRKLCRDGHVVGGYRIVGHKGVQLPDCAFQRGIRQGHNRLKDPNTIGRL